MSLCGISRRRLIAGTAAAAALSQVSAESLSIASAGREAVVYQTTSLTAEGLVAALRSVQSTFKGRIAVKLHTGEPHGPNILPREWVKALINELPDAVIVETNTLYGGPRATASRHRETLVTNGWTFAPVDILDEEGGTPWPIAGGSRLKSVTVGSHLDRYDSMLVLTHFKGHAWRASADRSKTLLSAALPDARERLRFIRAGNAARHFSNAWLMPGRQ